jgi:diguanylate cyclase (GGDEF)-like protein
MPIPAETRWHTDDRGIARLNPAGYPPAPDDQPAMLDWALAAAAAAEQRIADLEERLAYLESLSVTDELTAVLNRRGMVLELSRAISAAARSGPRGVLVLCDLNGFKAVNDLYGHRAGNEVLCQMAARLRRRVRKNDVVGRIGGDEFAILLIGASLANARRKCDNLCRDLSTSPPEIEGIPVPLSASFGLAAYDGSEDHEALLHRADMEMYKDKRHHAGEQAVSGREMPA